MHVAIFCRPVRHKQIYNYSHKNILCSGRRNTFFVNNAGHGINRFIGAGGAKSFMAHFVGYSSKILNWKSPCK